TVVLGEGIQYRIEFLLFLGLVLPVGVHGQAERILPLVPVGDLDALEMLVGIDVLLLLVAGLPVQVAGQVVISVLETEFLLLDCHGMFSDQFFHSRTKRSSSSSTLPPMVITSSIISCTSHSRLSFCYMVSRRISRRP